MCGILGLVTSNPSSLPSAERLEAAGATLRHRGPDGTGTYRSPEGSIPAVSLGHCRLSIIDLAGGAQPMSNEDGTVWVTYNGEIYNFQELRKELEATGHRFRTRSDTEVIVHAYEAFGEGCVKHFRGMFAFALWDGRAKRLLLARDRLGQKPLYYAQCGDTFAFASQPKAIFALTGLNRRLDAHSLDAYLTYQYVPHPRSIYEGIRKLPPAHALVFEGGKIRTGRYWQVQMGAGGKMDEEEACERLRELLKESVRMRLVSDVPLGAFLSGGVDSTIIVGLMAELMDRPVETFTIGFEESDYNELEYAAAAARRFGSSHHEQIVRPDAIDVLPKLAEHFDEPFGDSSAIPTYYLAQMTRQHVTVALTGDAGDETFAGYRRYKAVKLAGILDRLPSPMRRILDLGKDAPIPFRAVERGLMQRLKKFASAMSLSPERRYYHWMSIFSDAERASLYTREFRDHLAESLPFDFLQQYYREAEGADFISATTYVDLCSYLPGDLLTKVDVATMAHGLEARSPFLDPEVVAFAASLPIELKLRGMKDKYLLKRAFSHLFPESIRSRSKMGFGVPLAHWFRGELKGFVREHLLDGRGIKDGFLAADFVRQRIEEHENGRYDHGHQLYALLMFELWLRRGI